MKSRLLLNLALLVLIAILGAVAFFEPGKKEPETTPLVPVDENALAAVTLQNKDTIKFEKQNGHWRLTAPFNAPANDIRVRQLIGIAEANSEAQYPISSEDLAKFDLDKPKATLILDTTTLKFGGSDPINMRRYVQIGDTLHLVGDDFFHHLTASATDYVDKKLLPEDAKINEIIIPGLKATLGQDGKWILEPPAGPDQSISDLLNAWNTARAIDVKRVEQPIQADIVRITLAEGSPIEFHILQREPDLVLVREDLGLQYEVTGNATKRLLSLQKPDVMPEQPTPSPTEEEDGEESEEDEEAPPDAEELEETGEEAAD
ncbi:putative uncharacterized protein [Methylocaldum marinum]|uniref:DUF4340 domain-containing protein n=1 Tax=Methylocaldum marinum TaxID=1432792 RepID=A0A250KL62_9GAMM|nr:DUF4340 domain-containing protein [Methylocaldum marinum]BBA32500.1 putative uncharacterized protein [Methylocaldum marinum]